MHSSSSLTLILTGIELLLKCKILMFVIEISYGVGMGAIQDHVEKLSSLLAIAESRSLTKASVKLGMTQPALSRQLKILEEAVGSALFERSSSGVVLTTVGEEVVQFAKKLQRDLNSLEEKIVAQTATNQIIKIGTFDSLSVRIWPKLVAEAEEKFPELRLGVRADDHDELLEALRDGEVDGVMSLIWGKADKSFVVREIFEDCYGFFCSPEFRDPSVKACKVERMKNSLALVQTDRCKTGDVISRTLEDHSIFFERILPVQSFEAAANYAREGIAVAVLPYIIAAPSLRKNKLIPYITPEIPLNRFGEHKMGFYWSSNSSKRSILRSLSRLLSDYFTRELPLCPQTPQS